MEKNKNAQNMAKLRWKGVSEEDRKKHMKNMAEKSVASRAKKRDLTELAQGATME